MTRGIFGPDFDHFPTFQESVKILAYFDSGIVFGEYGDILTGYRYFE